MWEDLTHPGTGRLSIYPEPIPNPTQGFHHFLLRWLFTIPSFVEICSAFAATAVVAFLREALPGEARVRLKNKGMALATPLILSFTF